MSTYLVVSNHTAESYALTSALQRTQTADPTAEFVLLVPAPPAQRLSLAHESSLRDVSRRLATRAASSLREAGFTIRWTVVADETPLVALETEVRDHPGEYSGLVVATLPEQRSRWHDFYLLRQAESLGLTLDHVVDEAGCAVA
jgi:hypothetical protein